LGTTVWYIKTCSFNGFKISGYILVLRTCGYLSVSHSKNCLTLVQRSKFTLLWSKMPPSIRARVKPAPRLVPSPFWERPLGGHINEAQKMLCLSSGTLF
jgi:hypothetical protein